MSQKSKTKQNKPKSLKRETAPSLSVWSANLRTPVPIPITPVKSQAQPRISDAGAEEGETGGSLKFTGQPVGELWVQ